MPSQVTIEALVHSLPSMLVVETLTAAFFAEVNWRYGIPEEWFRGAMLQMWESLQKRQAMESQINANWLMLASTPQSAYRDVMHHSPTQCSDDYFIFAMTARRIAEDDYLSTPSTRSMTDGTVLGCLAALLMCNYLAEQGRVSEAWKLVGHVIRNAVAVGIHRDPDCKLWQMMSADEKLLRRRAWWGMYIWDK
ncbi:hypothetical protein BYT27DRAFT_6353973 [Phlegmacium glaucopus]|nr:hypothetical protein BYT27DRAFT_6353973 [Phlegmacium glaucopus]